MQLVIAITIDLQEFKYLGSIISKEKRLNKETQIKNYVQHHKKKHSQKKEKLLNKKTKGK